MKLVLWKHFLIWNSTLIWGSPQIKAAINNSISSISVDYLYLVQQNKITYIMRSSQIQPNIGSIHEGNLPLRRVSTKEKLTGLFVALWYHST